MPCGGLRQLAEGETYKCWVCDKPGGTIFIDEWDAGLHYACVPKFLASEEGRVMMGHGHGIWILEQTEAQMALENRDNLKVTRMDTAEFDWKEHQHAQREHGSKNDGLYTADTSKSRLWAAMGLAEEAGECVGVVRKHEFYGRPYNPHKVLDEAGDVLWFLIAYLQTHGWTLEDAARHNRKKVEGRWPGGFTREDGLPTPLSEQERAKLIGMLKEEGQPVDAWAPLKIENVEGVPEWLRKLFESIEGAPPMLTTQVTLLVKCPNHNDKRASCHVRPDGSAVCLSCGWRADNIVEFIMHARNFSRPNAEAFIALFKPGSIREQAPGWLFDLLKDLKLSPRITESQEFDIPCPHDGVAASDSPTRCLVHQDGSSDCHCGQVATDIIPIVMVGLGCERPRAVKYLRAFIS